MLIMNKPSTDNDGADDDCQAGGPEMSFANLQSTIAAHCIPGADVTAMLARCGDFAKTIEGGEKLSLNELLAMMREAGVEPAKQPFNMGLGTPSNYVDAHGHVFAPEQCKGIPAGRVGWECPRCTLFVMTDAGTTPATATTIHVSAGSFEADNWERYRWDCEGYSHCAGNGIM